MKTQQLYDCTVTFMGGGVVETFRMTLQELAAHLQDWYPYIETVVLTPSEQDKEQEQC